MSDLEAKIKSDARAEERERRDAEWTHAIFGGPQPEMTPDAASKHVANLIKQARRETARECAKFAEAYCPKGAGHPGPCRHRRLAEAMLGELGLDK